MDRNEDTSDADVRRTLQPESCHVFVAEEHGPMFHTSMKRFRAKEIGRPQYYGCFCISTAWLLLVDHPRPADLLRDEADSNLDTVGDFDEGNAAIHPVVLTVESQCPLDVSRAGPLAGKR